MHAWIRCVCLLLAGMVPVPARAVDLAEAAAKLDALRLPDRSFAARFETSAQARTGGKQVVTSFDLYARRTSQEAGATFEVVLQARLPAADAGKRVLFTREGCWMQDPKAKRPVKVPAQQLWSQGSVSDSLTWSLSRDFVAADGGPDTLELEGGAGRIACHRVDFTPRPGAAFAASPVSYWLDSGGNPLQAVHTIAAGRPWRTVQFTVFQNMLGARRPVTMRSFSRNERLVVHLDDCRPFEVPVAWTSPDSFGTAALPQPGA